MKAVVTTHVLDLAGGVPAAGVTVTLLRLDGESRKLIARVATNADGRTAPFEALDPGAYELVFEAGAYFSGAGMQTLYDEIPVRFNIAAERERYHIPLLLAPWGYSTYRGS